MDPPNRFPIFVNKVKQSEPGKYFIIKTEWLSNKINLQILDNHISKEWEGDVYFDELKESAEELEIPYDAFLNECNEALTSEGGAENFKYSIEDDKFTLVKKDQFQIQYLEVNIKPNAELKHTFALTAVDLIASLQRELSQCKEASKDLNEKYQTMVARIDKCLEDKNQLEKNLLEKFAVLLNSKKDKIAELQDLLVQKNAAIPCGEPAVEEQSKRKSMEVGHHIDESEDFMLATQVMTQPVTRTLPKRVKLSQMDLDGSQISKKVNQEKPDLNTNESARRLSDTQSGLSEDFFM